MSNQTHLDELVDYPQIVVKQLTKQQDVLNLLANKIGASYEDLENEQGDWTCFFDYEYIPGVQEVVGSYVCVRTDITDVPTGTIKTLKLFVEIIVHKNNMRLSHKTLPGYLGNRRDNLARYCDLALRGNKDFGIGPLTLANVKTFSVGNTDYTGKRLTYQAKGFCKNRSRMP